MNYAMKLLTKILITCDYRSHFGPMQANALNSDCTKTEKERLNRMLEEMLEESDMWLVNGEGFR